MAARRLQAVAIAMLTAVSCGPLQGLIGGTVDPSAAAPASGPAGAQELASRMRRARSDSNRTRVLLDVMDAVHIGAYTPDGQALVRGAERGWGDFYLYDFELEALSENLGREQTYDLYGLASLLEYMGLQLYDQPISAEDLLAGLRASALESVQTPDDPYSFVPLLVREIGLQRPEGAYDLAQDVAIDAVVLDGLQLFLLVGDIMLPYVYATDPIEAPVDLSGLSRGGGLFVERSLQGEGCGSSAPGGSSIPYWGKSGIRVLNTASGLGSKLLPALKLGGKVLSPLVAGFATIEAIHGMLLAASIEVKEVEPRVGPTHYGHENPGQPLRFGIRIVNHADFGDILVRCGWLSSVKFPPKGPVSGVHVVWFIGNLDDHGQLDCKKGLLFPCYSTSGSDGVARLVFTPKNETRPYGQGLEREEVGLVRGLAQYLSTQGNSFVGRISEHITPLTGSIVWEVRFHRPQAYQASGYLSGLFCPYATSTLTSASGESVTLHPGAWPGGTATYAYSGGGCSITGEGSYLVELDDSGNTGTVTVNVSGTTSCSGLGSFAIPGGGPFTITADPDATCGG